MAAPKSKLKKTKSNKTSTSTHRPASEGLTNSTNSSSNLLELRASRQSHQGFPPSGDSTHAAPSSASESKLETLPVEVLNHILSYLITPRSRLPGLSEGESAHDFPRPEQHRIKGEEDRASSPDTERFAADLFSWTELRHPFNALAATSKRCCELVESYSAHLVKACNRFNLPFPQMDEYGAESVYPDLSGIVYRRLLLQVTPRPCVFCGGVLSAYPHRSVIRLLLTCEDCFYAQALTPDEIQRQYHISDTSFLAANGVRASSNFEWVLRIDVEALVLKLYGTRAFHATHPDLESKPCEICRRRQTDHEGAGTVLRDPKRRRRNLPAHVKRTPGSTRAKQ